MSKRLPPTASTAPAPIARDTRTLVERLLDTPHAAQVIPRLQPEVLHRVLLASGLQDSGELVALASPAQLQRVFDFDLWRAARPGHDERLDADRFGEWLEVLIDAGPEVAAEKLLGMDQHFVAVMLAQHIRVFDGAAFAPYATLDGQVVTPQRPAPDAFRADIGGFFVIARRTGAWDSLVPLLQYLDAEHRDDFGQLMRACITQSNAGFETDASHDLLTGGEQDLFDVSVDRERRMEKQGYASPAQARAFLQSARHLDLAASTPPARSPIAGAYFHEIAEAAADALTTSVREPQAETPPSSSTTTTTAATVDEAELAAGVTAITDLLSAAGIVSPPRALLGAAAEEQQRPRLTRIQTFLQDVNERDHDAASMRLAELAFLTNTIAAGSSVLGRPFTVREAGDAAVAICNLGLENWPAGWPAEDLLTVFQAGWAVLHREVGMHAAEQLIATLGQISTSDRDIQLGLRQLRTTLTRHWRAGEPWHAHDALEVLAMLDLPAWIALTALIDECPVMHAAVAASLGSGARAIDPQAFEFISENAQIATIRRFLHQLPDALAR